MNPDSPQAQPATHPLPTSLLFEASKTLLASLAGIAAVAAIEYLPMLLPGRVNSVGGLAVLRLLGMAGGLAVALRTPRWVDIQIGSAIVTGCGWKLVEGLLETRRWAPIDLRGVPYDAASARGLDAGL